jgi:hypothetical protein
MASKSFMTDIKDFCKSLVKPGTMVNDMATKGGGMSQEKVVDEAIGFQECCQKMSEGKISYAEMRARYG